MSDKRTLYFVGIAFLLSIGLLLVILSCAIPNNWYPLFEIVFFLLSPLPNLIASRLSGNDLMMANQGGTVEAGYFVTSIFVVSGIAFPAVLYRGNVINSLASMFLALFGGIIVYGSMTIYSIVFGRDQDTF